MSETVELEAILTIFSVIAVLGSWAGSWFAIKSLLRVHNHRLDEQKDMLKKHDEKINAHGEDIAFIKANMERRA